MIENLIAIAIIALVAIWQGWKATPDGAEHPERLPRLDRW